MNRVYIAFGSNLGDRESNIRKAILWISEKVHVIQISGIYETQAENMLDGHQFPFLNGVLVGETELEAMDVLDLLMETEKKCGRIRMENNGHEAREIDLDLLIFNELLLESVQLNLPHPRMHERWFVLRPLMDIEPLKVIPGKHKTVQEFFSDLSSKKERPNG